MANVRITIQELNAFRHQTSTGKHGETLYHAPMEINDKEDLLNYGIGWDDCKTITFGGTDRRVVFFYETDNQALAEEQWKQLNREHTEKVDNSRCMIRGKRKQLIRCHSINSCKNCPHGKKPEEKLLNMISLDRLQEDGWDVADRGNSVEEIGMNHVLMEQMEDVLGDQLMWMLKMNLIYGYTAAEISEETGYPERRVYYMLETAKTLAREWLAE